MRTDARLVLALAALTGAPAASAWGPQGHRTSAAIADELLSPQARAAVRVLLADDRDKFGRPSHRTSLEAVSTWADEIRGTPAAQPRWHYVNIPVCGRASKAHDCPGGECNTEQLPRLIGIVGDLRASLQDRNVALKWVVHLVADLHQPLHAADNDDAGGNRVAVALEGVRTRGRTELHGVWDNELVQLTLGTRGHQRPPPNLAELAQAAQGLLRSKGQATPEVWAEESNTLARTVAYHFPGFHCDARPAQIVVLDLEYQRAAEQVIHERLLLAGARLAGVLNQALGGSPARSVHVASPQGASPALARAVPVR
jgi:hypothetical protein